MLYYEKILIILFFICFFLSLYAQKVKIEGLTSVYTNELCMYKIILDPSVGSATCFVICGKYGSLVGFDGDTITKVNIKGDLPIQVRWGNTVTSDAYVRVFDVNNPSGIHAELKNINIQKISDFNLQLKSSSGENLLQYTSFNMEALIDPAYVAQSYTWSGDDLTITSGQGTNKISCNFSNSGYKEIQVKVISGGKEFYAKKSFTVFPKWLQGPNLVCDKGVFYIENLPSGMILI
ncbi:MAG: hypothetical protein LUH63_14640 [Parabacteroides sp.]|nr:hypothetical protein [Parabacteroides sp.]